MKAQGLGRNEMLKSQKEIDALFQKGKKVSGDWLLCKWIEANEEGSSHVRVVFSVPKKRFKKAVDRNLLKRRMREAYRKNKIHLIEAMQANNKFINMMFIYQSDEIQAYQAIEDKIVLILKELIPADETSH